MPVVHLKKASYDVYIGRGSAWGNPFAIARSTHPDIIEWVATREEAIRRFEEWARTSPTPRAVWIRAHVKELKGKTLGCFCAPQACHGDVLLKMAEEEES